MEIKLIYNSNKSRDREAFALVSALNGYIVNAFDVYKTQMTNTQIANLAFELKVAIEELFDIDDQKELERIRGFSDEDKLQLIHYNMSLMKTPIITCNGRTWIMLSPFELHPIDLEIVGIKKNNKPSEL